MSKKANVPAKVTKSKSATKEKPKSIQSNSVYFEAKTKGIIYHVTAPKGVDMNELAKNMGKAVSENGGIVVTPENVVINTIYNK